MNGVKMRNLYEAKTGNKMFGVGKNDHDIYMPVAEAHQFMGGDLPEGYAIKHELNETPAEKTAREQAIKEQLELEKRRQKAKDEFIAELSRYFEENHESPDINVGTDSIILSEVLSGPLEGYESAVAKQLKNTNSANDFIQGIISSIGPDGTKEVTDRITKGIV